MSQFPAVITLGFSFMEAIVCDMIVAEANSTGSFLRSTLFFLLLMSSLLPLWACRQLCRHRQRQVAFILALFGARHSLPSIILITNDGDEFLRSHDCIPGLRAKIRGCKGIPCDGQ